MLIIDNYYIANEIDSHIYSIRTKLRNIDRNEVEVVVEPSEGKSIITAALHYHDWNTVFIINLKQGRVAIDEKIRIYVTGFLTDINMLEESGYYPQEYLLGTNKNQIIINRIFLGIFVLSFVHLLFGAVVHQEVSDIWLKIFIVAFIVRVCLINTIGGEEYESM